MSNSIRATLVLYLFGLPFSVMAKDFNGEDGRYKIISRYSGKAMDVEAKSRVDGANILMWEYKGSANQQWDIKSLGNGYYTIRSAHSGKAMDVIGFCREHGCDIKQWEYNGGSNQQWKIDYVEDGFFKIVSRWNGLVLDVKDWDANNGADVHQWGDAGTSNQQWKIATPEKECGEGNPTVRVTGNSGSYKINGNDAGTHYFDVLRTAIDLSGPGGRVSVMADGSIGNNSLSLPSNITFEVCGTMHVGYRAGRGAIQITGQENVSIPYLKMTGSPYFGFHIYDAHNLHLGKIDLQMSGGLGIRFNRDKPGSTNVTMDEIYVSGTGHHGVETWNVDGLKIGTIVARNTRYSGLLLNNTRNATIGTIDGEGTATGTGYATLRFANENGRINNGYPANIFVDKVISRGGGRGLFCVSNSGGAEINHIDFANNGNNSILIENCHNVTINGGVINGGGEVRIAARSEFPNTSDIRISNLNVKNTNVREHPCGNNVEWNNVEVDNGSYRVCN